MPRQPRLIITSIVIVPLLGAAILALTNPTSSVQDPHIQAIPTRYLPQVIRTTQPDDASVPVHTPTPAYFVVKERNFGSWGYAVIETGGLVQGKVVFRDASIAELKNFAEINRALIKDLAAVPAPVDVSVTFNQFITLEDYGKWVLDKDLTVSSTILALQNEAGNQKRMLVVTPSPDNILPVLTSTQFNVIRGVTSVSGTLSSQYLHNIVTDKSVFLVDVTSSVVRSELTGLLPNIDALNIETTSPFWIMEEFGLENFR